MSKQMLTRPRLGDATGTPWHSFASACYAVLNGMGRPATTTATMGLSGLAFRLNIDERSVHVAAPSGFDWTRTAHDTLRNLGYEVTTMGAPNHVSPTAEELAEAIDLVRRSIDAGRSVLAWDLFCGEFGVIYGYDDDAKHFHAVDCSSDRDQHPTRPYAKLGRGDCTELFLMAIEHEVAIDPTPALRNALQTAVTQARVPESFSDDVLEIRMVNGLAGYDAWIQAFERGAVDAFGNAFNTAVYRDARNYAVRFLRSIAGNDADPLPLSPEARACLADAADHYAAVAAALGELAELFPFPKGGQPNDADQAAQAVTALRRAQTAEQKAVGTLAQIIDLLSDAVEVGA